MIEKKDFEAKLKEAALAINPEYDTEFQIIIKAAGELPNLNDAHIANLVQLGFIEYQRFLRTPASVTSFHSPVYELAKNFKEKKMVFKLEQVYDGKDVLLFEEPKEQSIPLPITEYAVFLGTYSNKIESMTPFNYNNEKWRFYELQQLLSASRAKIFSIFNDIINKHNIQGTDLSSIVTREMVSEQIAMPEMK